MNDTTTDSRHYHVASGLAGYGPDAADTDGFPTFDTLRDAVQYASVELVASAEYLYEGASAAGDAEDYETAWLDFRHSENLRNMAASMDIYGRADAPLFTGSDGADALARTIDALVESFPIALDRPDTRRLYLWDCTETDCHNDDDEDELESSRLTIRTTNEHGTLWENATVLTADVTNLRSFAGVVNEDRVLTVTITVEPMTGEAS